MFDRFTKLAATTVLALGVAGGASAQGLGSYSGPYVGLMVGYGAVDLESSGSNQPKESMTGFDLLGFVGYEVRQDRTYYSIEGEVYVSGKENDIGNGAASGGYEKDIGYAANIRAGYFMTDGTLLYGLAGLEIAEFTASTAGNAESSETILGARLGLGTEVRATDAWSVRAEYVYTIYEDASIGTNTEFDISDSTFRIGGVYRFSL